MRTSETQNSAVVAQLAKRLGGQRPRGTDTLVLGLVLGRGSGGECLGVSHG